MLHYYAMMREATHHALTDRSWQAGGFKSATAQYLGSLRSRDLTLSSNRRKCLPGKQERGLARGHLTQRERQVASDACRWLSELSASAGGTGVVVNAGSITMRLLADR